MIMKLYKSGESHGKFMVGILTDVPYGIPVDENQINLLLKQRNAAYGRSARQKAENDELFYMSGVTDGVTIGNNVSLIIENHVRKTEVYSCEGCEQGKNHAELTQFRPGHADMPGAVKYGLKDARVVAEGASARNTCLDVAAGGIALSFLRELGVKITAFVRGVGNEKDDENYRDINEESVCAPFFTPSSVKREAFKNAVDKAAFSGDTLGGEVELRVSGVKCGLGGYVAERRVNGVIARLLSEIQAVKGVYFGANPFCGLSGTEYADKLEYKDGRFFAATNNCGGIDGGMTNGGEIVVRVGVKPLPTVACGVPSVNSDGEACVSDRERSDVTAVFALCPILKCTLALGLAQTIMQSTGGDSMKVIASRYAEL